MSKPVHDSMHDVLKEELSTATDTKLSDTERLESVHRVAQQAESISNRNKTEYIRKKTGVLFPYGLFDFARTAPPDLVRNVFFAAYDYDRYGKLPTFKEKSYEEMMWDYLKPILDENIEKYIEKSEINKLNKLNGYYPGAIQLFHNLTYPDVETFKNSPEFKKLKEDTKKRKSVD